MKKRYLALAFLLMPITAFANVKTYQIDKDHSIVSFRIGHLIGKVQGSFSDFTGEIKMDEKNPKKFSTASTINVDSISTNNKKRDDHLKSPDFFDVNSKEHTDYKTITFEAKNFQVDENTQGGIQKGKLNGYITIHGFKQPITLDMTVNGDPILDPFGNARISISATGSLNRQDFGLNWKHPAGEIVVGDVVEIDLEVQGFRKVQEPKSASQKNESKKDSKK
ncbi:MAG: polyisoprenoid-binding protein [Bdellovibrionales bacterium]|nr:polyisoprenoid-binding protein [Bdellovibrionales bacterium]